MFNQKEYAKQYYIDNKNKLSEYDSQRYIENREKLKKQKKQYYINHAEYYKQYRITHKKEKREYMKKYGQDSKERRNECCKKRYNTNILFRLNDNMSRAIRRSLKGNKSGKKWETLVGYVLDDLVRRFKKTMPEGYNWDDFIGGKLHIDHIIPKSIFNFDSPEHIDFKRCWALNNLQLLPARENKIKSNKLKKPYQLALRV